jgi:hypothetical protein
MRCRIAWWNKHKGSAFLGLAALDTRRTFRRHHSFVAFSHHNLPPAELLCSRNDDAQSLNNPK